MVATNGIKSKLSPHNLLCDNKVILTMVTTSLSLVHLLGRQFSRSALCTLLQFQNANQLIS